MWDWLVFFILKPREKVPQGSLVYARRDLGCSPMNLSVVMLFCLGCQRNSTPTMSTLAKHKCHRTKPKRRAFSKYDSACEMDCGLFPPRGKAPDCQPPPKTGATGCQPPEAAFSHELRGPAPLTRLCALLASI